MDGLRATALPQHHQHAQSIQSWQGQGLGGRKGQTHQQKHETSTEEAAYQIVVRNRGHSFSLDNPSLFPGGASWEKEKLARWEEMEWHFWQMEECIHLHVLRGQESWETRDGNPALDRWRRISVFHIS